MDINAKLRPLYLLEILKQRTDEDHFLSTNQLCKILKDEYGMDTHRTTIKADMAIFQKVGLGVQEVRSTQNLYNFIGRDFDQAELKLLIDAVESAKFMTKNKSDALAAKLADLAGMYKAKELKRNLVVDGRIKQDNEQILVIVDAINDAINQKKKTQFQKTEFNAKKERVLHNDGEVYTLSPYSLVWDGDCYYVVGYSDKYERVVSHRVDRILKRPEILEEDSVPPSDDFDINKFINTMFRMYDAPRREVELICDNDVMDAIIDRFGVDVKIYPRDSERVFVESEVAVGKLFYNWVFGFGGKVKIAAPEDVKEEYKKMVLEAAEGIKDSDF